MKSRRAIILLVVVVVICGLLIGFNYVRSAMIASFMSGQQRPPVPVSAVEAQAVNWTPIIDAVGTAKAGLGADLAVEAAGVVKAVSFTANQKAAAGQVLVQIDDSVEQADMVAAQANIKLAEADVARIRPLVGRGASTQASLDEATARLDTARATAQRLQAVTNQKAIEAPFAGVVGVPRVVVGQYVSVGTVVVTLQDLDRILIDFTVPEQSAGLLQVGQKARFGITTDKMDFTGTVIGIDPKVDPQTRLVSAQAMVDAPAGRILPGQFLRVQVLLPEQTGVIAVPETALMPSLYGDYVFVVVPEPPKEGADPNAPQRSIVKQAFVKAGRRDGERIELAEGVSAGDMVIVAGQNRLQNGAAVKIVDNIVPGSEPAAPAAGAPK